MLAMVAWKNALSADDIEALLTFFQNWDVIEEAGMALEPPQPIHIDLDNPEEVLTLGERIYSITCVACHGDNGSGGTGMALNSQQLLTRNSDEQLHHTIVNGGKTVHTL